MNKLILSCVMALLFAAPSLASANISIFACEPEWASLANEIGGKNVKTYSATHAQQDPHHIRARPSLIAKVRNADIVICTGGGLEDGWLGLLLQKASASLQPQQIGNLMASDYVTMLEKPAKLDRSLGHLHASGNPHINTNPHNFLPIAKELMQRFKTIDPKNAASYQARYDNFVQRWQEAIKQWELKAASLKGKQVITHHQSFSYLIDWLGMKLVDTLEPKPGIPPTSKQLELILSKARTHQIYAILRTPYEPQKGSEWLAEKTSIPAITLPYTIGGSDSTDDLFGLFEVTLNKLLNVRDDHP